MPLQDHFHPPLSIQRHWHSFHNAWATYISSALNRQLPEGYFAEPNVQFGIEIDVGTFQETSEGQTQVSAQGETGAPEAVSSLRWIPPRPTLSVPLSLIDDLVEVEIFNAAAGPTLVGAIELASPGNK